jgi:hypothetical protein
MDWIVRFDFADDDNQKHSCAQAMDQDLLDKTVVPRPVRSTPRAVA